MRVLVLGLPRTATQSIADALVQLGIAPIYHMREVGKNKHQDLWIQAIEAKYEDKGKAWERQDFEQILASFEGAADFPAAIFPEELIRAYPEAQIVLSTRPEDAWYASMLSTLWHGHRSSQLRAATAATTTTTTTTTSSSSEGGSSGMAALAAKYHAHCWGDDFPARGRACFRRHNELVRRLGREAEEAAAAADGEGGRRRKFLEYDVRQGWGPLCAFLGVPVPEGPMPRKDDWAEYKRKVEEEEKEREEEAEAAAAAAAATGAGC